MRHAGARRLVAALLAAGALPWACGTGATRDAGNARADSAGLRQVRMARFSGPVFGASGVVQLDGGDDRVLVVEDERRHPLDVVTGWGAGAVAEVSGREVERAIAETGLSGLNDLESVTADPRGRLYAVTSHSLTADGERKDEREVLVRFGLAGASIVDARVCRSLRERLAALDTTLAAAASRRPKQERGLNIEGMAYDPAGRRLLLGFRSPLAGDRAMAVWLTNPDDVFDRDAAPALAGPVLIDLGGEGIRDLAYDATLGGFLVLAGAPNRSKHATATLWLWRGEGQPAVRVALPGLEELNAEGLAVLHSGARRALLVVSDDGEFDASFAKGRSMSDHGKPARYLLVPYDRLLADNPSLR